MNTVTFKVTCKITCGDSCDVSEFCVRSILILYAGISPILIVRWSSVKFPPLSENSLIVNLFQDYLAAHTQFYSSRYKIFSRILAAVSLEKGGAKKKGRGTWTTEKHPSPTHPVRCNFIALPVFGLRYNTSDVERKFGGSNT
jgi:hypothetical protein